MVAWMPSMPSITRPIFRSSSWSTACWPPGCSIWPRMRRLPTPRDDRQGRVLPIRYGARHTALHMTDDDQSIYPRLHPRVFSNDGDELQFCSTCAFSQACLSQGMDKSSLMDLHVMVEHVGPFHEGDVIFHQG